MVQSQKMKAGTDELLKQNLNAKWVEEKNPINKLKRTHFLTDIQTSDYTQSSRDITIIKIECLEQTVRELRQQNSQLKQAITKMKAKDFFQFNEGKLKQFIKETQILKNSIKICKDQLEKSLIQKDFLSRYNKNLKAQYQKVSKELIYLKKHISDAKKLDKTKTGTSSEDSSSLYERSCSLETTITRKRDKKKLANHKIPKTTRNIITKNQLNQQYFIRQSKSKYKISRDHGNVSKQ